MTATLESFQNTINNELNSMKARVEKILRENEYSRSNDTYLEWLILRDYMKAQGYSLPWVEPEVFRTICNFKFETVRRCRQMLQASGMYAASPQVQQRRDSKRTFVRHWAIEGKTVNADPMRLGT